MSGLLSDVNVKSWDAKSTKLIRECVATWSNTDNANVWLIAASVAHVAVVVGQVKLLAKRRKLRMKELATHEYRGENGAVLRIVTAGQFRRLSGHGKHGPLFWEPFALASAILHFCKECRLEASDEVLEHLVPKERV